MSEINQTPRKDGRGASRLRLALYFAAYAGLGMVTALLGPSLPRLAEQTHIALDQAGSLFFARYAGYLLAAVVSGRLYDRARSANRVLAAALAGMIMALALAPWAGSLAALAGCIFALGVMQGGVDIGGTALLLRDRGKSAGPAMNGLHLAFGVGSFTAPLIVAQSLRLTERIDLAYWGIGLALLPVVALLLGASSPPHPAGADRPALSRSAAGRLVPAVAAFFFLYIGAEASMGGWLSTYAVEVQGLPASQAAYTAAWFWLAITGGRLAAIPLSRRVAPARLLAAALAGAAGGMALLVFAGPHAGLFIPGVVLSGVFMALIFPGMINYANQRFEVTGARTGAFLIGSNAGAMLLPYAIGRLMGAFGGDLLFPALLAILSGSGMVLAWLLSAAGRKAPQADR